MFENGGHLARIILLDVPKMGILISGKKLFRFRGVQPCCRMSQKRGFLFPEKSFSRFRGVQPRRLMSQKWGFLFPENSFSRFRGGVRQFSMALNCAIHFAFRSRTISSCCASLNARRMSSSACSCCDRAKLDSASE